MMRTMMIVGALAAALATVLGACFVWAQQPAALGNLPFSPARQAGATLYLSGQIGMTAAGEPVRSGIADETRQTMRNLEGILTSHGYAWGDVVSMTVYLRSMDDYAATNEAYREFFDGPFPARACVGGLQIAFGLNVEISAIAYKAR